MGFPMREVRVQRLGGRVALIGVMLAGGLLTAGISQAQDIGATDAAERTAEAVAAAGGPVQNLRLIPFAADRAAVETRDDDVAPATGDAVDPRAQPVSYTQPAPPQTSTAKIARVDTSIASSGSR